MGEHSPKCLISVFILGQCFIFNGKLIKECEGGNKWSTFVVATFFPKESNSIITVTSICIMC